MFSSERIQRLAPEVMLDIVAELAYWRSCYPYRQFYSNRMPFEAYVPTFKFGYDTFLLHHREGLFAISPQLPARYERLQERERLQWKDASLIVAACWQRMLGEKPT